MNKKNGLANPTRLKVAQIGLRLPTRSPNARNLVLFSSASMDFRADARRGKPLRTSRIARFAARFWCTRQFASDDSRRGNSWFFAHALRDRLHMAS